MPETDPAPISVSNHPPSVLRAPQSSRHAPLESRLEPALREGDERSLECDDSSSLSLKGDISAQENGNAANRRRVRLDAPTRNRCAHGASGRTPQNCRPA